MQKLMHRLGKETSRIQQIISQNQEDSEHYGSGLCQNQKAQFDFSLQIFLQILQIFLGMCLGRFVRELILFFPEFLVSSDYDFFFFWMAEQSERWVCHLRTAITEFHQPQQEKMLSALLENLLPSPQQRFIFTLSTEYLYKYLSSCSSLLL